MVTQIYGFYFVLNTLQQTRRNANYRLIRSMNNGTTVRLFIEQLFSIAFPQHCIIRIIAWFHFFHRPFDFESRWVYCNFFSANRNYGSGILGVPLLSRSAHRPAVAESAEMEHSAMRPDKRLLERPAGGSQRWFDFIAALRLLLPYASFHELQTLVVSCVRCSSKMIILIR